MSESVLFPGAWVSEDVSGSDLEGSSLVVFALVSPH